MTGIILVISAVFLWSAHRQFGGILRETAGARLASSATLVAGMIGEGLPAVRASGVKLAALPEVRHALTDGEDSTRVGNAIRESLPPSADSTLLRIQLIDSAGRVRQVTSLNYEPLAESWAVSAAVRHELSKSKMSFSPILEMRGMAQIEYVIPVHLRDEGESHIGYLVETRAVHGRGVDAVRRLIGTGTMLFGQPGAGVWSDLESVVDGPPAITALDSILVFRESPRGPGVGVAKSIRGTPWVVWLQISDEQVLEPVNAFLLRMTPVMLIAALLGATAAWWLSRRVTGRIVRLTARVDQVAVATAAGRTATTDAGDEIDRLENAYQMMSERAKTQQQLEAQLQQSQKLEAVGRLAGGIAHDFNNVLTVVTNFGEIIQADLEPNSATARDLDQILQAANRASRLTRQLLAFSRRQMLQPVQLDINEVVRGSHRLLERLIPSRVSIALELDPGLSAVFADPLQIEQVLLNLAVNASDAMPDGGRLTFRTTMSALDDIEPVGDSYARSHVCLTVKDTGMGMDRETVQHVFEPFFTTKPMGKGTGLGLSTVHGIISQLGGRVWVYSELGRGTTFKLYLPAVEGAATPLDRERRRAAIPRGAGTVLIVEDDQGTREVTKRLLARHGYGVIASTNAADAIELLEADALGIQLVLSDVMMPGMNGIEFARLVMSRWPEIPVLLMSGYSDTEILDPTDSAGFRFIEKPFTSASLLDAVAGALEREAARHSAR